MKRNVFVFLAAVSLLAVPRLASGLDVGDTAPALEIEEWVKGEPINLNPAQGSILLLEFWATW